jgi:hypothetical protein
LPWRQFAISLSRVLPPAGSAVLARNALLFGVPAVTSASNFPTKRPTAWVARADFGRISQALQKSKGFCRSMNGRQFIYHMQGLTKTYPAGKKVLDNVNLSF